MFQLVAGCQFFKLTVTFFSSLAFPDYAVPLSWTNTEPEMCHRLDFG